MVGLVSLGLPIVGGMIAKLLEFVFGVKFSVSLLAIGCVFALLLFVLVSLLIVYCFLLDESDKPGSFLEFLWEFVKYLLCG